MDRVTSLIKRILTEVVISYVLKRELSRSHASSLKGTVKLEQRTRKRPQYGEAHLQLLLTSWGRFGR